jgi:RNA polymerase sigma factor (sigma-70 family)
MTPDLDVYHLAIAARSETAFALWVAASEDRLRRSLAGFARDVDTEAVMQETLLRLWQVAPKFEPDGRPDGLLRLAIRIARNLAITELRRRRPTAALPPETEAPPPATEPEGLREAIDTCFELLPQAPRDAMAARLRSAGTRDEALAESLGMKPNTFFQNIRRARLALLRCLAGRGINLGFEL